MIIRQARASLPLRIATALVLVVGFAPALFAEEKSGDGNCSLRSLNGTYGFYRTGKGAFGGPLAGDGIATFDGSGNWNAVVNNVRDGEVSLGEEFSGTYTIAPDCTGVLLVDELELERLVIVDNGRGYYALNVGGAATIYIVATRIQGGRGADHDR